MIKILDLYCGAGGASAGYKKYFPDSEITGVDLYTQRNYPYNFIRSDALEYLEENYKAFDFIHASPPCQLYSMTNKLNDNNYPDLIPPTRKILQKTNKPYVIENVKGSPLIDPVELCGAMFDLKTYRHRLFESSFFIEQPVHPEHKAKTAKMGRMPKEGEFIHVVGNYAGASFAREAMQINWMNRKEMAESIPPVYTEYVSQFIFD